MAIMLLFFARISEIVVGKHRKLLFSLFVPMFLSVYTASLITISFLLDIQSLPVTSKKKEIINQLPKSHPIISPHADHSEYCLC